MKSALYLIFVSLLHFSVQAQGDYRAGFIINFEGDSTRGFVRYQSNEASENQCLFRISKKGAITTYTPAQLSAFGFDNGKYFESKNFIDQDESNPSSSLTKDSIFVETLVKGKVSLYRLRDNFGLEKDGEFALIYSKRSIEGRTVGKVRVSNNEDIRVIANFISDCNQQLIDFKKFKVSERYLTELIGSYNKCVGEPFSIIKESIPWKITKIKPNISFGTSQIEFSSSTASSNYVTQADFETPSYFQFGVEFNFIFPRVSEKSSWVLGLQFNQAAVFEASTAFNDNRQIEDVRFELASIAFPVGLRFNAPNQSRSPYAALGTTLKLNTKKTAVRHRMVTSGNSVIDETFEPFQVKSVQIGIWMGVGLEFKVTKSNQASFEVRYENTNGIVRRAEPRQFDLNSNITNLQFIFGVWL